MKILFVAYHDPTVMDLASGTDYFYYQAMCKHGFDVKIIKDMIVPPNLPERLLANLYQRTGKRYIKFNMTTVWNASQATNKVVRDWMPDLVFAIAHFPFVFYTGKAPCVYRIDSTAYGEEMAWPRSGWPALRVNMWQEKRAQRHCARVITVSEWSKNILEKVYKVPAGHIRFIASPSYLPDQVIPESVDIRFWKNLADPLRLLLVGRDYHRKGIDVGIDIVHKLNTAGIRAELTICGAQGTSEEYVRFVGPYKKSDPDQLEKYIALYRQAHLLIHPAIFEPAGIVPSEAAAFGTPTITNDVGGLATTVKDGESGIVLPKGSPAEVYVQNIIELVHNPDGYYRLCCKTRERYERELNWGYAGKWLAETLREVISEQRAAEGLT
ncbi:MAG: glycosyltransferase family 4 protein [Anaerolineales bacterium]|jgi:glycosyltransferase involved in cell wall biosynthesis